MTDWEVYQDHRFLYSSRCSVVEVRAYREVLQLQSASDKLAQRWREYGKPGVLRIWILFRITTI